MPYSLAISKKARDEAGKLKNRFNLVIEKIMSLHDANVQVMKTKTDELGRTNDADTKKDSRA